jgi:hypothetical protein
MFAFWEDVKIRPSLFQTPGACRPLPMGPKWVSLVAQPVQHLQPRLKEELVAVPLRYVKPFFVTVAVEDLALMDMPGKNSLFE